MMNQIVSELIILQMYDSNSSLRQDSSSNSESIQIQYEQNSIYRPSDDDESYLAQKCHKDIGDVHRIIYRIQKIYKCEDQFRDSHRSRDKNKKSSSFDNTVDRNKFKVILIKNMRLVHLYLHEMQKRTKMRRVIEIKDIEYHKPNIVMKIERMEFQFIEFINKNPNPAIIAQLVSHFVEGLEELEKHHLYDLDRHIGNFMVKIENGQVVGKHIDFQLSLYLHPNAKPQMRYYNIKILGSKNYQHFYSRFGKQMIELVNSLKDKYNQLVRCKDVLRKIHAIQLFKFVKDVKKEIQPYAIKNSQLKKVVNVLDKYLMLQSRETLIQNLQKCLLAEQQIRQPLDVSAIESRSELLSSFTFTRQQLLRFFDKYDFINNHFDGDKNAKSKYFVRPILNIQIGERIQLDSKTKNGIRTIISAIEQHMAEEFDDEPKLFSRLVQLLKMQLGQEQLSQRSQPQSQVFFELEVQLNNQAIGPKIPAPQQDDFFNNSKITCYNSILEYNPRSEQELSQDTQRVIEPIIPPLQRSLSNGQDEVLRLFDGSSNFEEAKDIQLFMNFIKFEPPTLQQLTKFQNQDKFVQLYSHLIKKGFAKDQIHSEINRIDFTGNEYFIQKLQVKIQDKFVSLYKELIKKGDVVDLVNSKYLEGIKEKYLETAVKDYFNLSYFKFKENLKILAKEKKFVLTPQEEKIFFQSLQKLYEHEPCNVFRNFLKQHIIAIFGNAKKFLRGQEGLHPSTLLSARKSSKQKTKRTRDRISSSSKKEGDHDKTTSTSLGSVRQCNNSHNTHQVTTQNFYINGRLIPNLIELGLIKKSHSRNSDYRSDQDQSQYSRPQYHGRQEEDSQSDNEYEHQIEEHQDFSSENEYYSDDERF